VRVRGRREEGARKARGRREEGARGGSEQIAVEGWKEGRAGFRGSDERGGGRRRMRRSVPARRGAGYFMNLHQERLERASGRLTDVNDYWPSRRLSR
jgi:hypothetical protein